MKNIMHKLETLLEYGGEPGRHDRRIASDGQGRR